MKISDSSAFKFCSIRRSKSQRQVCDQAQNHQKTNPVNTLRPRDSFCFLLVSSHFFYPKFKRGSCNSKYEYHSTTQSIAEPLPSSRQRHSQNGPKTLPGTRPRGHGHRRWPRPPWPSQRSAARPRRNGLSEPHIAAPSPLGAEDARRTAGLLRLPSRNKV